MDDLPAAWLATLDCVVRAPHACTGAARAFGVTGEMVAAGWLSRLEDDAGSVTWTLTPMAAEWLGVCLVEFTEGEPRWIRQDIPADRDGNPLPLGWSYPDPPLVARRHPREVARPDQVLLHIPDPHSDPARAEARRRAMSRRERRKRRRDRGRRAG
jgi:hypothetical protein